MNVPKRAAALVDAIAYVIDSFSPNTRNQVLVQEMVPDVVLSGVILTRDINTGSPYYVITYDDGSIRTDRVTAGLGLPKTVLIHREAPADVKPVPPFDRLLEMTREVEGCFGDPREALDIEFAVTRQQRLFILQVRSIAPLPGWKGCGGATAAQTLTALETIVDEQSRPKPGVAGTCNLMGQMPDWNPAELLGMCPRPLAISLFRHLITDSVWQEARASMGYRTVAGESLMIELAGRPYIDVRNSFNSFLPAGLPFEFQGVIVDAWIHRLHQRPEFHDKVEFEVAQTALDFNFTAAHKERYPGLLRSADLSAYTESLARLTNRNLSLRQSASLGQALQHIAALEQLQAGRRFASAPVLGRSFALLRECCQLGTRPFAVIARHAFIAEAILRSAVERGAWTPGRLGEFKRSLHTVSTRLGRDLNRVLQGKMSRETFLYRYGHLRPGTFNIVSPRYDRCPRLLEARPLEARRRESPVPPFSLSPRESADLERLAAESGLRTSSQDLLVYCRSALTGRERAKFVFSRHLSEALEAIAQWGHGVDLSREELSWLSLDDLRVVLEKGIDAGTARLRDEVINSRRRQAGELRRLRLGSLIRTPLDLWVIHLHPHCPNFVTSHVVEARPVRLDNRRLASCNLSDRIVCIESADPGFDWIFTREITGLITKFGGANSHMAIRCAEQDVPAAIGVGEELFERLAAAGRVELSCRNSVVRPVGDSVLWPGLLIRSRPRPE